MLLEVLKLEPEQFNESVLLVQGFSLALDNLEAFKDSYGMTVQEKET